MFVRSRKSSPILRMISLWLMSILPVSLMISGMSFVSSIVVEMSFSNCAFSRARARARARRQVSGGGKGKTGEGRQRRGEMRARSSADALTYQGNLDGLRERVRERELGPARRGS